ncbi:hypothetical protein Cfor_11811 [Coptotermes formosanus]|uniref:Nucleolar protein 11 n=1 Tax=Coptotermes formosanus TaxID=36987 RepID=A0A6L2PYV9_COPFO|nr:hypothetical protein Cfor_11811 [Coptotermes formosanus]
MVVNVLEERCGSVYTGDLKVKEETSEKLSCTELRPKLSGRITSDISWIFHDEENIEFFQFLSLLLSQKQISSWSSKGKLSSPVVYDIVGNQYIAVFSRNELRLWTEHEENLDKIKKIKLQQQIHCVIPQKNGNEPLIMFSNGAVCPLSTAVGNRKEEYNTSLLDSNEIVEDYHLVTYEVCTFITILSRSSLEVPHFSVVPVSGSISSVKLKVERKGFRLVGQATVQHDSSCNFLTLWSDGRLYSLPFHPQPSPDFPGTFVNTVRAVSTKHPVALLALSSSHVAVYGADPSEEVPYKLEAQQLSALVGAHCSDGTDDSDVQELHYTPCASWVADSTTKDVCCQPDQQVPEAIKGQLAALQADGCCQSVMVEKLVPQLLETRAVPELNWCIRYFTDIPEKSLVQILMFCLESMATVGREAQYCELLNATLHVPFSDVCMLPRLRTVPFHHVLTLLHYLTEELEAYEPEIELHSLVEWASLLLDAQYQRCLLSGDPQVLELLRRIHKLVIDQISYMNNLKTLLPILQQFQEGRLSVKKTRGANKLYCVEYLRLY